MQTLKFTHDQFRSLYMSRIPKKENETVDDFISLLNEADVAWMEYVNRIKEIQQNDPNYAKYNVY